MPERFERESSKSAADAEPAAHGGDGRVERRYSFDPRVIDNSIYRGASGLEVLRMVIDGRLPIAPIGDTMDFWLVEAELGRVVLEGRPARFLYNFTGAVQGGWAATILDAALGLAVLSGLPKGRTGATTELSIRYVRPITEETGLLRAEGTLVHLGRRLGTSEARLTALRDGKLYAHGSTSCMVFDVDEG